MLLNRLLRENEFDIAGIYRFLSQRVDHYYISECSFGLRLEVLQSQSIDSIYIFLLVGGLW